MAVTVRGEEEHDASSASIGVTAVFKAAYEELRDYLCLGLQPIEVPDVTAITDMSDVGHLSGFPSHAVAPDCSRGLPLPGPTNYTRFSLRCLPLSASV